MNRMQNLPKIGRCWGMNAVAGVRAAVLMVAGGGLAAVLGLAGCVEPLGPAIPAETARVAIQSQCAQNVINCTTSWPVAMFQVEAGNGQMVTLTDTGYLIEGSDGNGQERVRFVGSNSNPGDGATLTSFRWTSGATDEGPRHRVFRRRRHRRSAGCRVPLHSVDGAEQHRPRSGGIGRIRFDRRERAQFRLRRAGNRSARLMGMVRPGRTE